MIPSEALEQLQAIVGPDRLRTDIEARITHSYDATPLFQSMADGVIYPQSTQEVQKIIQIANQYQIPIVSRGSGTNLCAATVPPQKGLVMVMTKMNQILEIDEKNLTVTVQPGVLTKQLHKAVEAIGLFYPPDPGSMNISTIGGNIALNSGGLRGLKYGTTKDYVLGLEAVLPTGEIIRTGGKLAKDVAGYDITRLLVGSEGTLAVITEATLKLLPKPEERRVMTAFFPTMEKAAETVAAIIAARIIPCTMEFMDQGTIRVVEDYVQLGLRTDAGALLILEQDGPLSVVERDILRMEEICRNHDAMSIQIAHTDEEANQLLSARRFALSALARATPTTILEDATVPRAAIPEMVRRIEQISQKYGIQICTFGHAGDGNLHPTCMTDARNKDEIEKVEKAFAEIFDAALKLGGTITGEHGVGLAKAPYLKWQWSDAGVELMKRIKDAFDPHHILNPGKFMYSDSPSRKQEENK